MNRLGVEPGGARRLPETPLRRGSSCRPRRTVPGQRDPGDQPLGEYVLEDGSAVICPLYSIHRDDRYFEAPETFDPDRWARRDPDDVDAYMPFSTGPHACVGRGFALSGATLVLARLVREFDVDVAEDALGELRITPTLRPVDGVTATVRPLE